MEYLLFPKILGLAERGWNAHPVWENLSGVREQQAFNQALQGRYMEKLTALLSQQIDKIWRADKGRQQPRRDLEWKQHHPPTPVSEHQQ